MLPLWTFLLVPLPHRCCQSNVVPGVQFQTGSALNFKDLQRLIPLGAAPCLNPLLSSSRSSLGFCLADKLKLNPTDKSRKQVHTNFSLGKRRDKEGMPIFKCLYIEREAFFKKLESFSLFYTWFRKNTLLQSCLGWVIYVGVELGSWEVILVRLCVLWSQIAIIESVLYKNPLTFIDYASYAS